MPAKTRTRKVPPSRAQFDEWAEKVPAAALADTDLMIAWLRLTGRYSDRNTAAILAQAAAAEQREQDDDTVQPKRLWTVTGPDDVAGYSEWIARGRQVRTGDKSAIAITRPRRADDPDDDRPAGYHTVWLFHRCQTEPITPTT